MNTNKEVEWGRFIVPKKVEQINDHLLVIALIVISSMEIFSSSVE